MNIVAVLLASIARYVCGSVSSTRLVSRLFAPETDVSPLNVSYTGSDLRLESDGVIATLIRMRTGVPGMASPPPSLTSSGSPVPPWPSAPGIRRIPSSWSQLLSGC
jgi:hypothetical protein